VILRAAVLPPNTRLSSLSLEVTDSSLSRPLMASRLPQSKPIGGSGTRHAPSHVELQFSGIMETMTPPFLNHHSGVVYLPA
jgi:hypothetical protein